MDATILVVIGVIGIVISIVLSIIRLRVRTTYAKFSLPGKMSVRGFKTEWMNIEISDSREGDISISGNKAVRLSNEEIEHLVDIISDDKRSAAQPTERPNG